MMTSTPDKQAERSGPGPGSSRGEPRTRHGTGWQNYLLSTGLVLLVTLVGLPLRPYIQPTNLVMFFLGAVMVSAVWLGLYPTIVASALSVVLFTVFFVPPYYSLSLNDVQYMLTFAGLLTAGVVISRLAARVRDQPQDASPTHPPEAAQALQTALLDSISHDLRTPLASITGALSSLLEDADLLSEAAREEQLQTAWDETLRLNRLVGNLLDMTRLQSGAMTLVCRTNDVEDLVGATMAQMPRRLQGRLVRSSIPRGLSPVEIDLALVVQALVNLLDNALKFAPADQPVDIEAYQEGEWVILAVKDRGPGLPDVDSALLFNKFFRGSDLLAQSAGSAAGTGLGLSIAKGIVEVHGGQIWAANRHGGGAVFSFSLPITPA